MASAVMKTVRKYGNSGGIYVPSSWIGGKVKAELVDEPLNPMAVLSRIALEHVVSAVLYGSYARKDASPGSDIDIVLVTDGGVKISIPDELKLKCDVQVMTEEEARDAMSRDPVFHKIITDEAVALINRRFLDSLKKEVLKRRSIRARLELAESSLKIAKEIFEAGDDEIVYPVIMRLKEMLILECIVDNRKYSSLLLRSELLKNGIKPGELSAIMDIYRASRSGKQARSLSRETIGRLVSLLEMKIQYVRQKAVEKGH